MIHALSPDRCTWASEHTSTADSNVAELLSHLGHCNALHSSSEASRTHRVATTLIAQAKPCTPTGCSATVADHTTETCCTVCQLLSACLEIVQSHSMHRHQFTVTNEQYCDMCTTIGRYTRAGKRKKSVSCTVHVVQHARTQRRCK